jgi:hypothetical protein
MYLNNLSKTNAKWQISFLSSYFPPICIFSFIFVHISNSLHKLLNIIYAQSTSIPSSIFMNVNAFFIVHVIHLLLLVNHRYKYKVSNVNLQFTLLNIPLVCIGLWRFDIMFEEQFFNKCFGHCPLGSSI